MEFLAGNQGSISHWRSCLFYLSSLLGKFGDNKSQQLILFPPKASERAGEYQL